MDRFSCFETPRCHLTFQDTSRSEAGQPPLRLSCNRTGELFWTKNRMAWEEWYILTVETASSVERSSKFLKAGARDATSQSASTSSPATPTERQQSHRPPFSNVAGGGTPHPAEFTSPNRALPSRAQSATTIPDPVMLRSPLKRQTLSDSYMSPTGRSGSSRYLSASPKHKALSHRSNQSMGSPLGSVPSPIRMPLLDSTSATPFKSPPFAGSASRRPASGMSTNQASGGITQRRVMLQSVQHGFVLVSFPDGSVQVIKPCHRSQHTNNNNNNSNSDAASAALSWFSSSLLSPKSKQKATIQDDQREAQLDGAGEDSTSLSEDKWRELETGGYHHWDMEFDPSGQVVFSAPAHGGRRLRVSNVDEQLLQQQQRLQKDLWNKLHDVTSFHRSNNTSLAKNEELETPGTREEARDANTNTSNDPTDNKDEASTNGTENDTGRTNDENAARLPSSGVDNLVPMLSTVEHEDVDPEDDHWWQLEWLSGELCSISHTHLGCRIQCDPLGGLHIPTSHDDRHQPARNSFFKSARGQHHHRSQQHKPDGWQIFRFIPLPFAQARSGAALLQTSGSMDEDDEPTANGPQYMITSWTHHDKYLTCDPDGHVYTTDFCNASNNACQRWIVQPTHDNDGVLIESVSHGRLLSIQRQSIFSSLLRQSPSKGKVQQQPNKKSFSMSPTPTKRQSGGTMVADATVTKSPMQPSFAPTIMPSLQSKSATKTNGDDESNDQSQRHGDEELVDADLSARCHEDNDDGHDLGRDEHDESFPVSPQTMEPSLSSSSSSSTTTASSSSVASQKDSHGMAAFGKRLVLSTLPRDEFAEHDESCKWDIKPGHCHTYYLSCQQTRLQLASDSRGNVKSTKNFKSWEQWTISAVECPDDETNVTDARPVSTVTLQSAQHGTYLGATQSGKLTTTRQIGPWSFWELRESGGGAMEFVCTSNGRVLVCSNDGGLSTRSVSHHDTFEDDDGDDSGNGSGDNCDHSEWNILPCLPGSLNGSQMAAMAAAGAAGVTLSVCMPLAILGIAEALTAAEIAAAGVISTEALAAAAGGGALAGAGMFTGANISIHRHQQSRIQKQTRGMSNPSLSNCKPVSMWRSW